MNRYSFILLIPLLFVWACNSSDEHGHEHTTEDGGHAHPEDELSIDTVIWTDHTELFVEFPALVKGKISEFAAHFTDLEDHKPIVEGKVTVSMIKGESGLRHSVDTPSSKGIFIPALQPKDTGIFQLVFDIESPGLTDRIKLGNIRVYASEESAMKALENKSSHEGDITFSKEQAWKSEFSTAAVERDTVYKVIRAAGQWMPAPGTQQTVNAGAEGNVVFAIPSLTPGREVRKGQLLMTISGKDMTRNNIQSEVERAKSTFDQAKAEYERKKELHQLEIVPKSEFEEVKKRYELAQSNYQQLVQNYSSNGVRVTSPISGYIKSLHLDNGDYAVPGRPLVTIGTDKGQLIKANVSSGYHSDLMDVQEVWVFSGQNKPDPDVIKGEMVSVGRSVTADQPQLPVYIKVNSPVNALEGSLAEVELAIGKGESGIVIPKSALLEDFGQYAVIVQITGESFELRPVQLGVRNAEQVAVINGLKAGERVVTKGVYRVKMASMSGEVPAHGHTH